jgi:hypothetical protein
LWILQFLTTKVGDFHLKEIGIFWILQRKIKNLILLLPQTRCNVLLFVYHFNYFFNFIRIGDVKKCTIQNDTPPALHFLWIARLAEIMENRIANPIALLEIIKFSTSWIHAEIKDFIMIKKRGQWYPIVGFTIG